MAAKLYLQSKRLFSYAWRQKGPLAAFLIVCGVAANSSLLWPGGLGFGERVLSVKTIERNNSGDITRQTETIQTVADKTLWDWISLLGVPLSLALLGAWLQSSQRQQTELRERAKQAQSESNAREEALQSYFDRISTLLVDKNLLGMAARKKGTANYGSKLSASEREVLDSATSVIRASTLSLLRRLDKDGNRKGSAIRFLIETDILSKLEVRLDNANLSFAMLGSTLLAGASLKNADLNHADLSYADLRHVEMQGANLQNAILAYSKLEGCNLIGIELRGTDFSNASYDYETNIKDIRKLKDASRHGES